MVPSNANTQTHPFKHLSECVHGIIYEMRKLGKFLQEIYDEIGVHKSKISRELKHGPIKKMKSDRTYYEDYYPYVGQRIYIKNEKNCGAKLKLETRSDFIQYVESKIIDDKWSPDAAWGYTKNLNLCCDQTVCIKTIYNYIEKGLIAVKNIDLPLKISLHTKTIRFHKNQHELDLSIEECLIEILDCQCSATGNRYGY